MKITLNHTEKKTGLVFTKRHYGVTIKVIFEPSELAIIRERRLERTVILERGYPSDVDPNKLDNRGVGTKLLKAAVNGVDSLHYHLTIGKLVKGPDTFHFETPVEAKEYEATLREKLPILKGYILDNERIEQKTDTFEL